jgi:serine/threonine protein kinase
MLSRPYDAPPETFEREARTIAALNHPNIVTIHSVEEAVGVTFLTMELVSGQSLSRAERGSRSSRKRAAATSFS